jgi:hypothetical protein
MLVGERFYRPVGAATTSPVDDYGAIVLTADEIEFLIVGYRETDGVGNLSADA